MRILRIPIRTSESWTSPFACTILSVTIESYDGSEWTGYATISVADDCPIPDGAVEVDDTPVGAGWPIFISSGDMLRAAEPLSDLYLDATSGPAHWVEASDLASVCREAFIAKNREDILILVGDAGIEDVAFMPCWEAAALAVARRVKESE